MRPHFGHEPSADYTSRMGTRTDKNQEPSGFAWNGPAIGLLDLDAFFAAVEVLDHPEWKGKPLIVGGSADKRGVVSTASYEARKYGVHSAMPSAQAARLCPDAIWVRGNYARYQEMSARVMACILDETPLMEQVSIDEAFFDITPGRYSKESPVAICRRIQARVDELGVTCSIGLGPNKTVAKIASDMDKPHGLTVVLPGSESEFLAPLPVRKMSGIGKAAEAHLAAMGIHTLGQLARADVDLMEREFGINGPRMVTRAAGLEQSRVMDAQTPDEVKSVSNERTFAHDLTSEEEIRRAIAHVSDLVAARLRKKGLAGSTVTLKVKFDATHSRTAQRHLRSASDEAAEFGAVAQELLGELWHAGIPVRLVGVGMSGFDEVPAEQLSLLDERDEGALRARRSLSAATDDIRERFGKGSVGYGRDLRLHGDTSDTVPMNKG